MARSDPGPCPICGAAHSACTADSGPITIAQLPARDGLDTSPLVAEVLSQAPPADLLPPVMDVPPPAPFSTAEYSRAKHGRPRR